MASIIQIRRDTATNWISANPILAQGELGFETDTLKLKCGNGMTRWSSLDYYAKDGPAGQDGYTPVKGEDYFDGSKGEKGEKGDKGERGEKGDKGDIGDPGLSDKQQDEIAKIVDEFSGKKFVEDDDPRLEDARKPKPHTHPEIQPMIYAPSIGNAGIPKLEGTKIRLIPQVAVLGAEGTIFYCATDNHVYVATE